jgi:hypothetical protein
LQWLELNVAFIAALEATLPDCWNISRPVAVRILNEIEIDRLAHGLDAERTGFGDFGCHFPGRPAHLTCARINARQTACCASDASRLRHVPLRLGQHVRRMGSIGWTTLVLRWGQESRALNL